MDIPLIVWFENISVIWKLIYILLVFNNKDARFGIVNTFL